MCVKCVPLLNLERERAAEIEADKHCEVCLQEASWFKPYIIPYGIINVSMHVGDCCDELFTYAKPDAEYTKTPRNNPCPCGSGQKF